MLDSIYHRTLDYLKSHFRSETSIFCHILRNVIMDVITFCHILRNVIMDVIT